MRVIGGPFGLFGILTVYRPIPEYLQPHVRIENATMGQDLTSVSYSGRA